MTAHEERDKEEKKREKERQEVDVRRIGKEAKGISKKMKN
jgi:hypothetical protein